MQPDCVCRREGRRVSEFFDTVSSDEIEVLNVMQSNVSLFLYKLYKIHLASYLKILLYYKDVKILCYILF